MGRRGKTPMEQVRACPKAHIKITQQTVHSRQAALNKPFNPSLAGQCQIVIESKECEYEATEYMCSWIDGNLFKENALGSNGCTDTAIKNVSLKSANSTTRYLEKHLLVSKL